MHNNFKRIMSCALVAAMSTVVLAGCGSKDDTADNSGKTKLTYWVDLNSNVTMTASDFGETPLMQELEKRLDMDIEFQHPPQGQATEKFNVLIAMDNLPDIIEYNWTTYPGGPDKAISNGTILDINEYLNKAPNLAAYLKEHDNINSLVKTDDGKIFGFPFIRGEESLSVSAGPIVRKDWLDDLGLEVPETIDEWETMLRRFRDEKGATAPLDIMTYPFAWGLFSGAYGVAQTTYVDNGKVKYGSVEPEFKEFLTTMNRWYNEGLIDKNIASLDSKTIDSNILNGVSGAMIGSVGSGIGRLIASANTENIEGFDLVGAPSPVLKKGDKPEFGHYQLMVPDVFAAITKSCENVDAALKLLDYGYGEEGSMLYNFGIEGESYNMVDGYPKYTDYITNNPDGLSMSAAMARYMRSYQNGPFVQDVRYMEQYASLPQQQEAWQTWADTNAESHILPYLYIDEEQSLEISKLENAITTYEAETVLKFIMGIEPIENFDKFVEEMNNRGLKEVLKVKQEAYDRYLQR